MNDWSRRARPVFDQLVERSRHGGPVFDADDIRAEAGVPDDLATANAWNNAVGSLFSQYSKAGRIECVGIRASRAAKRKGGMNRIWRAKPEAQERLL